MAKYSLRYPSDEDRFEQLARISHNLRHYMKLWKEHYGARNLAKLRVWEAHMDKWLSDNVDYTDLNGVKGELCGTKFNWVTSDIEV